MDIQTFQSELNNLTVERRRNFANRLLNELTKKINQEYKNDGDSILFEEILLPILAEEEANDYFGTEGFDA
jgi:hypothetical protein